MQAKYLLQVHPAVEKEDLPKLAEQLQKDYQTLFKAILQTTPEDGGQLKCHQLFGKLRGYNALEICYGGDQYRLIYKIHKKPAPLRVRIISFDIHDPAYEKAQARVKNPR
jgi:mRNA-degrading endonuclease RelE of RelBE toxin-antitoxin system